MDLDSNLIDGFREDDIELNDGTIVDDPLRVNEKFIIPMLVEAVKELSAKVDSLEAQISGSS